MELDRIRLDRMGVLELLRAARETDEEYVKIGERLVSGAGDYLPAGQLELLVRDDLTAEVARREIQRQKAFVRRLEELLPSLLRYFRKSAKADVVRAVESDRRLLSRLPHHQVGAAARSGCAGRNCGNTACRESLRPGGIGARSPFSDRYQYRHRSVFERLLRNDRRQVP